MSQQDLAAANQAIAQSNAALYGGIGSLAGTIAGASIGSGGGASTAASAATGTPL